MGKLRMIVNSRKFKDKELYAEFDLKKLYKQMNKEQDSGKTPELFNKLQEWGIENKIDIHKVDDLKKLAQKYLEMKGILFREIH